MLIRFCAVSMGLTSLSGVWGQFADNFTDGDFSASPSWSGTDTYFSVTSSGKLQLNAPAAPDTAYLSLPATKADNVQWDAFVRMAFNPSSSNYARIYVMADQANLKGPLNGYFVMIGNTADEISLYRQDGRTLTKIIDGKDDAVDVFQPEVRIQVHRDNNGNWELLRDTLGGHDFISEGVVTDTTYTTTTHFGVFCRYTSTRSDRFFFDELGNPYTDTTVPELRSATAVSPHQLKVQFSEPLDTTSATTPAHFVLDNGVGTATSAALDSVDSTAVCLLFDTPLVSGTNYSLTVDSVKDRSGNVLPSPAVVSFFYVLVATPSYGDVVITEVMVDPSPAVGLPKAEYVELYNQSEHYLELANWTLADASYSATLDTYLMAPHTYVLLTHPENVALFSVPNLKGLRLPSLNNTADAITLRDAQKNVVDSIAYTVDWYHDPEKTTGGWSIERKHLDLPCAPINNWCASVHPEGGTPGVQNSVWAYQGDMQPPAIEKYTVHADSQLVIKFNKPLDTNLLPVLTFSPPVEPPQWQYSDDRTLQINTQAFAPNRFYSLVASNISDCWGNTLAMDTSLKWAIPMPAQPLDVVVNELLFNPLPGEFDYVELYNRSQKIIDLSTLLLANWEDDSVANQTPITTVQKLLLPQQYVVLTEDTLIVQQSYGAYGKGMWIVVGDLPSYPDNSGAVYVVSKSGVTADFFHYDKGYHFDLVSDVEGKSLERISTERETNVQDNWHTAAETAGWGTPGYENSQFSAPDLSGTVSVEPRIFSPDNDGHQDVLTVVLNFQSNGNVVDVEVFDHRGRLVRQLKDNFFVGNAAALTWDGIDERGEKAAVGMYVLLISVIDDKGKRTQYKEVVVLGGHF